MAKEEREEDGPLTIAEEWRASLVGLQLQFQKQMLSVLIDKGLLTGWPSNAIIAAARINRRGIFVMAGLF
jgi:hypothetical protein